MSEERKAPQRHPSTLIPEDVIKELSYRVYLMRLEPPMTPEQSKAFVYVNDRGGRPVTMDDAYRRRNSISIDGTTRQYLRVLVDMGMIKP